MRYEHRLQSTWSTLLYLSHLLYWHVFWEEIRKPGGNPHIHVDRTWDFDLWGDHANRYTTMHLVPSLHWFPIVSSSLFKLCFCHNVLSDLNPWLVTWSMIMQCTVYWLLTMTTTGVLELCTARPKTSYPNDNWVVCRFLPQHARSSFYSNRSFTGSFMRTLDII